MRCFFCYIKELKPTLNTQSEYFIYFRASMSASQSFVSGDGKGLVGT